MLNLTGEGTAVLARWLLRPDLVCADASGMPLSALLEDVVLDATLDEMAPGVNWATVHRVRPRPVLICPACGARLHAKVSPVPRRLRYFAHDAEASDCPLSGESLAHRLLKVELASAIREAGWEARLEVAGGSWRADVLASDPRSQRRVAWEAQLSSQTADETAARTDNLRASDVEVCWVTDKRAPWLGAAPGVRIARDDDGLKVVEGHARLDARWCKNPNKCEGAIMSGPGGPCDGHGEWSTPLPVSLPTFVGYVLHGRVRSYRVDIEGFHRLGPLVWTAPAYERLAAELTKAEGRRDEWLRGQAALKQQHELRVAALLKRQGELRGPVMDWMLREREKQVVVADGERGPRWAMGVPVYFGEQVLGVVCPVASRLGEVAHRLAGLTIFAASAEEGDRIARASPRRLDVIVLEARPRR